MKYSRQAAIANRGTMKLKSTVAILAVAVLTFALFLGCGTSSKDAYESFSLLMNKLAGQGQWSDKGHADKLQSGALIVNGLTVTLPPAPLPEGLKQALAEATGQDLPELEDQPRTMTFATVEIKNIAAKKAMADLVALSDWKGQKGLKLAEAVKLKGVTQQVPMLGDMLETSIEEVNLSSLALAASASDAPDGLPGFLKAVNLGSLKYKNFKMTGLTQLMKMDASVADISVDKVAFDGEQMTVLDAFDPSGLTSISSAMSYEKAAINKAVVTMEAIEEDKANVLLNMTIDSITQSGAKGVGKIEDLLITGLKYDFQVKETAKEADEEAENESQPMPPVSFVLGSLSLKGFDMSSYLSKITPLLLAMTTDPENANEELLKIQTLGDLFVSPFSLKELNLKGMELAAGDLFSVKLAEAGLSGPFTAGQIAPTQKSHIKGLEIVLPEDPKFNSGNTKEAYEFGRQFGMTRFFVDGESEGSYNAETGLLNSKTTRLAVKDLFELSGEAELGGLTKERVEAFNNTPFSMAMMAALMSPDMLLGDLSFNKLNMKLDDKGLTDRILAYTAARASDGESKVSADDMRQLTIMSIKMTLDVRGREVLANPEVLTQALVAFYTKPQSLELKIDAQPPLSFKSVMSMAGDNNKILNSLNISVSANGEKSPVLKFDIDSAD